MEYLMGPSDSLIGTNAGLRRTYCEGLCLSLLGVFPFVCRCSWKPRSGLRLGHVHVNECYSVFSPCCAVMKTSDGHGAVSLLAVSHSNHKHFDTSFVSGPSAHHSQCGCAPCKQAQGFWCERDFSIQSDSPGPSPFPFPPIPVFPIHGLFWGCGNAFTRFH